MAGFWSGLPLLRAPASDGTTDNPSHLLPALCILERASAASRKSHILRLHLVRVYRLLGCGASLAIAHYITLGSAVQPGGMAHDGVAYNVVARASTFAFAVKAEDEDLQFEKPGMLTGGGAARMMQLCGEANMMYRPYLEHVGAAPCSSRFRRLSMHSADRRRGHHSIRPREVWSGASVPVSGSAADAISALW